MPISLKAHKKRLAVQVILSVRPAASLLSFYFRAIPHNSKYRYGERGAADAKPKAQIILDAAKVSAASGGNSEPKQGQRSQSARGFCPQSTMRVPQPDIIEHFGNADAVPQLPERCLSRKAGIVRCCPIIIKTQKQYNSHNGQARCGCCFWCPFSRGKKSVPIYFDCIVDTAIIMPP